MSAPNSVGTLKAHAQREISAAADKLVELSRRIHADPELCFEEVHAAAWCAEALEREGFALERAICDLPTAFRARRGDGSLSIGLCAEYDALPDIGHACGHNIIAAASIGAAIGLKAIADDLGLTINVIGTPAEEGGGGKILLLERGGFDDVNAAMMVHPWPSDTKQMPCLAVSHFDVLYRGVEAHASAFPDRGINAADALTVAQVAIGLLRQHAEPGDQVHGIVTHGGDAPNIIPSHTSAKYYVRARSLERLAQWRPRIEKCFEAGAIATGSSVEFVSRGKSYSEFRVDEEIADRYVDNALALGRVFPKEGDRPLTASTDMANVSLSIPAIHPTIGIDSLPTVNHQAAFAAHCVSPAADKAIIDGATVMAWTVIDLALDDVQRERLSRAGTRSR